MGETHTTSSQVSRVAFLILTWILFGHFVSPIVEACKNMVSEKFLHYAGCYFLILGALGDDIDMYSALLYALPVFFFVYALRKLSEQFRSSLPLAVTIATACLLYML